MKFRLYPTLAQDEGLRRHCSDARFVWNIGLEQRNLYRKIWGTTPNLAQQSEQLTEARDGTWLASGSATVQQQALRDLDQAFQNWWRGSHGHPTWRKAGVHEGFRVADRWYRKIKRLSRNRARILIPKVGWVNWRWSRDPGPFKSYRVKLDPAGRWWIIFAAIPEAHPAPGNGSIIGIDRGVAHAFVMSDGEMVDVPKLGPTEKARLLRLQRRLARQVKGSVRRSHTKRQIACLRSREANRRKDAVEKLTTRLAATHDFIRIEDLNVRGMTRAGAGKRGLNRVILESGWGTFAKRLEDKAPGRVEKVVAAYTSQRCSACGHTAKENRKSQAAFDCQSCGYQDNADVNAAKNIAAGHAVSARGGIGVLAEPAKREPLLAGAAS